ncbi:MAG: [acyl-carrier-protein] S-malonyltransferase [Rhodospirillales bacterium CG15_BIG_FIL_POST_REV_8_21_14_020_66_15]|nr:MAG: [acyl-carrier-protein] S-malonyltransferase [Rhodospirillales bacterium CG15_BIG_FIL_POST_REV_8_21_14_020_66_15]
MARALIFPGQGSQTVGMGKAIHDAFAAAREVHEEVDETLKQKLSKIMFEGPEDELTLTANAQPAIMTASLAVMAVLRAEGGFDLSARADFVAGHSLGEYSALAAAGAFSLADTARLLKTRGTEMQKAVPVGQGAMAALMGLDMDAVEKVCEQSMAAPQAVEGEVCQAGNDNAPGQIVISGSTGAVERAVEFAKAAGAKRAVMLPVSAPFHCVLMQPAADAMDAALGAVQINAPAVPVMANVTAAPVEDPAEIQRLLVEQVTGMVRWRESVEQLKVQGVDTLVEIGSGKVLAGLVKRIDRELNVHNVGTPEEVEAFLASL